MIIDISDSEFKNILSDEKLYLPIRWSGNNFPDTLHTLFDYYADRINSLLNKKDLYLPCLYADTDEINTVCAFIVEAVRHYLDGFQPLVIIWHEIAGMSRAHSSQPQI